MKTFIKALLAGTIAAALWVGSPRPAEAIICDNCSDLVNQLMEYAQQAKSYVTQLQQLRTELQSYANMVQNTVALPMQAYSQVQGDIMQVQSLTNAASLLSGNSGSIISRLNSISAYSNQLSATGYNLGNIGNQFTIWQQTLGNNAQTMGRTLGMQQQQLASNAAIEQAIQQHSTSATGQMQAIQAGNELAAANGEVLNQMAQTLIAQAQMAQTASLVDADRRASEDAAMLHFSTYTPIAATGSQGF